METESAGMKRSNWWILAVVGILAVYLYSFSSFRNNGTEITWLKFEQEYLREQKVERLEVVDNELVTVFLKNNSRFSSKKLPDLFFRIGSVEAFESSLAEAQYEFEAKDKIAVKYVKRQNWLTNLIPWVLPFVFFFILWRFIFSGSLMNNDPGKSIMNFGRSSAKLHDKSSLLPTFKDVAGYHEAKMEVYEIVEFLKNPEIFTRLGAKMPKGILLAGPPGTGKTLMAKAIAGEAGVPFFSLSGSEFVEMFVGVGASRVRDLFKTAKTKTPCIIFIDELDTVGRYREKAGAIQSNEERESTLNQLLAEMDGFDSDTRIIVIAATNRPDILDPALTRAGRFDRHVYLELPNKNEREEIFKVYTSKLKLDHNEVSEAVLAAQTPGFSGADIANVCNEAALMAARREKNVIDIGDFYDAIEKLVGGLEKKSVIVTEKERNIIAWHEAGHALVSWMLPDIDPVIKLSVIPRGKSLGSTWYLPEERRVITRREYEQGMAAAIGGRAAEIVAFNELSSGAADDLEKVTATAESMVTVFGFSELLGPVSLGNQNAMYKPYSEKTAGLIDEEIKKLVDAALGRATDILTSNRGKLDELAFELLRKETLSGEEIKEILGERPDKTADLIRIKNVNAA